MSSSGTIGTVVPSDRSGRIDTVIGNGIGINSGIGVDIAVLDVTRIVASALSHSVFLNHITIRRFTGSALNTNVAIRGIIPMLLSLGIGVEILLLLG